MANPVVRAQATGLLVDAFPLQNPDAGTVEVTPTHNPLYPPLHRG